MMSSQRRNALERYLPLSYFGLALAMVVALVPTALRPPEPPPPTSAELSPDAPPDNSEQVIISELGRASSGTSGAALTGGLAPDDAASTVPKVQLRPRRGRCFGNPPRQTESLYSPPCAPAFTGDNGGATWKGVTRDEIRIAVQGTVGNQPGADGPYGDEPKANESAVDRTLRVLQAYLNQAFELHARKIRLYAVVPAGNTEQQQRNAAVKADEVYKVFAYTPVSPTICDEMARRELITFCPQVPKEWFEARAPHAWSWYTNGTQLMEFAAEYLCKKLAGKPASFAGDPTMRSQTRKFGLLYYNEPNWGPLFPYFERLIQGCGATLDEKVGYDITTQDGQAQLGSAIVKLRAAGITTVLPFNDFITSAALTNNADAQGYFPEWYVTGYGAIDRNQLAQFQNQHAWASAFGFTPLEMERRNENTDCYRAYKSIDPDNNPHYAMCTYVYPTLLMLAAGMQNAGPRLTPKTFQQGLYAMGYRFYDKPVWAIGGGFGPGDPSYTDNVAEIWYDATATDPQDNTRKGAYRYVRGGQRYRLGQLPREDPLVFSDGVTTTPDSDLPD